MQSALWDKKNSCLPCTIIHAKSPCVALKYQLSVKDVTVAARDWTFQGFQGLPSLPLWLFLGDCLFLKGRKSLQSSRCCSGPRTAQQASPPVLLSQFRVRDNPACVIDLKEPKKKTPTPTKTFVFMQTTKKQVSRKKLRKQWPECVRFEHHSVLTEDQSSSSKRHREALRGRRQP